MSATVVMPESEKKKSQPAAWTRTDVVTRLNREYALILLGDRPIVLREGTGADGRDEIRLLSLSGFHEWLRPDRVKLGDDDNGQAKSAQASKIWVDSAQRRQCLGLVFDPERDAPHGYYNLWKGWAVQPAMTGSPVRCDLFLAHVANNVCGGDLELYRWVMGWFAALFQRPTEKLGTSLVLRGTQGTGKTIVGRVIGSLLGHHYALVADSRYIVGRFNSHLANCLLLQLDEATWGGDHAAAGKLKDLITGDYQYIEYKGREPIKVRNYVRLLVTGNNRWLIPAGLEERRFAVLDVGEKKRQDSAYFQAIEDQLDRGGREALLRFLLDYDLAGIPLKTIPRTSALAEQKVSSLSAEQHWWLDILTRGVLPGDVLGEGETETKDLYAHYLTTAQKTGVSRKSFETQLGYSLKAMAPGIKRTKRTLMRPDGPKRLYVYVLPTLAECRREFDRIIGDDGGWGTDVPESWQGDSHQ